MSITAPYGSWRMHIVSGMVSSCRITILRLPDKYNHYKQVWVGLVCTAFMHRFMRLRNRDWKQCMSVETLCVHWPLLGWTCNNGCQLRSNGKWQTLKVDSYTHSRCCANWFHKSEMHVCELIEAWAIFRTVTGLFVLKRTRKPVFHRHTECYN